jgi:tetratricopeptide (TPR) repeat protein
MNQNLDRRQVLILTHDGVHREAIRRGLVEEKFKADFCNSSQAVLQLMASRGPGFFLHDWDSLERSQAIDLQHRFNKMEHYASLIRVVYAHELDAPLLALAHDASIRRVMSSTTAKLSLGQELRMLMTSENSQSDLQKKVKLLKQSGVGYEQTYVDKLIDDAYANFAHDPSVKIEYAGLCLRRSETEKAELLAMDLLQTDRLNVRALSLLSRIRMRQGRGDEAAQILEQANILSPRNSDRLFQLGETMKTLGRKKEAKHYFQQALEIDDENTDAQKGLGILKLEEGDANGALELLKKSMSEEEAAGHFNNIAVQAVRQGRYDESLKFYQVALQALQTNKFKPQVHFNIGLAHRRLGNLEAARDSLNEALSFDAGYVKAIDQLEEVERLLQRQARQ